MLNSGSKKADYPAAICARHKQKNRSRSCGFLVPAPVC